MNTVGPYHNRQETYSYFSLPFCQGPKTSISHYHETLGEALQGTELEFSGLQMDFKANVARTEYCQVGRGAGRKMSRNASRNVKNRSIVDRPSLFRTFSVVSSVRFLQFHEETKDMERLATNIIKKFLTY